MNKELKPYHVHLICNAKYHDSDFARLELLKLLSEHEDIYTTVSDTYDNFENHIGKNLLITYTCDLKPEDKDVKHMEEFLKTGGNWFALHGTNAILDFAGGKADTPNTCPEYMELLGSRFISHPPNMDFLVRVKDKEHQLTKGIEDFEVYDEPYYCEYDDKIHVLLDAEYSEPANAYVAVDPPNDDPRPQMYLHNVGKGKVLYLLLGHCRGKYDMRPFEDEVTIERCAWDTEVYYEFLRRGIRWGIGKS